MAIAGIGAALAGLFTGAGAIVSGAENSSAAKTAAGDQSTAAVKSAQIQADAANKAAQLQSDTAAKSLAYEQQQSQLALDQYNQQQSRLQPYRNLGSFALGQPMQDAPTPLTLPPLPSSSTSGSMALPGGSSGTTTPVSGAGSAQYQPLVSALNQGQSPQAVIAQFNASQGLPEGNSYAWRAIAGAPGGGVVEVPGGAYLAPGPNGTWGYTAAPASSAASTKGPVTLNYTPTTIGSTTSAPPTVGTLAPPPISPYSSLGRIAGVA